MDVELNNYTVSSGWARRVVSSRHAGLTRLLFLFALISPGAWADLPSFYGEKFVLKGKTWAEVRPPVSIVTASSGALKSEKAYRRQLDSVESTGGPYAYELAEPLLGLGRYHASNGRYGKARDLFRRALHNVRLNDGLYSELQTPYVRALLDTIRLSGDLNALDDRYNYFFRLYGSGQPPYTRLRMRASLEYLRWQREALRLEFDSQEKKRLLTLYQLNESLLTDTWESNSSSPEDQWKLTMSQIRNLYMLLSIIPPQLTISGPGAGSMVSTVAAQNGEIDFDQKRLETIQRGALSRGGFLLEQYISAIDERFAGITIEQRARAVLELADWYQWNGSKRRASEQYEAVVKILTEGGQGGLMQAWFGQPVELPDNGVFWQPPLPGPETEPSVVTATYDVTSQGSVKKLSVDVEGEAPVYRFKRELKNTRFRPRYDTDGESVYVEKLSREYELYD